MKKKRMFIFKEIYFFTVYKMTHFYLFCEFRCTVSTCMTPNRGTRTWALGVFCCVSVCVWVVISAADHVFQASDEAKQLWQRARFISGTGAQNKEKMIDWMMNYLEVESRGTNQPCWGGREGAKWETEPRRPPSTARSALAEDGISG